jgi:hypothetical protein
MNEQTINTTIKSSIFDRSRELVITPSYIAFEDKDLITAPLTRMEKDEIESFRYGIKWIKGYAFIIGRCCSVDIQSKDNRTIKIRLKSIYGINKTTTTNKFINIVEGLYAHFFDKISNNYLAKWEQGQIIEISGIIFKNEGIQLSAQQPVIEWADLGTKHYATYYALFSKSNPNQYKALEFLHDWNTGVVYSVSRQILSNKGLYTEVL